MRKNNVHNSVFEKHIRERIAPLSFTREDDKNIQIG